MVRNYLITFAYLYEPQRLESWHANTFSEYLNKTNRR